MHFPLGARGNNFDSQIKIISSWSKRIPFASSGLFCGCRQIIYYAPREEKTCEGGKHELWADQFYSRGAYTIFPHFESENAIFPFRSRTGNWHFRPGVRKKIVYDPRE